MKILLSSALLSVSLMAPIVVVAQEPTPEQLELAREAFEKGQDSYNRGEYTIALGQYKEAYRLAKKPTILFNIGQCHRKLGENQEAAINYKKFLQQDPTTQYLGEVEYKLAEIAEQLGNKQEALDYYEKYLQHKVADDPNEAKAKERISALKIELNTKVPDPDPIPNPNPKKPIAAYALFGIAGGAAIGGSIFGVQAFQEKTRLDDLKANGGCPNPDNSADPMCIDARKGLAHKSDLFWGIAIASAGVGTILFLKSKKSSETASKKPSTALRLIPTTTGGFVTFSFTPDVK